MKQLFLGVDGGQSSTTALIGDETGRVLGVGTGGPCNHVSVAEGPGKLSRTVQECLMAACAGAGLDAATIHFRAACFGMSGGPADKEGILAQLLSADRLVVTNDAVIALSGATAGEPGIITIAGTGSIGFGRSASGRTARVGGWGHIFGDEGSGFDIARQALRAALRMEEGWGPPTSLHRLLLEASGATDANELLHLFYSDDWPRSRVARLAPLVDGAAQSGDAVALDLIHQAAHSLALIGVSVRHQLWKAGELVTVAHIGGVFRSAILLERYRQLIELEEGMRCGRPLYGPAAGALLEAYRVANLHPTLTDLPEFKA
ncbi:MAG TPA: BadF/BadG/BcrA/BcrD ATPase family protein [Bryobacteraceae bacterium]|jgi:N-acetylglucosamine kinase-like BadF-type ATPase|nr:BadF/BadG/BcrA/BcrD ATPase family protein [Bryobacteraceae bacterium]